MDFNVTAPLTFSLYPNTGEMGVSYPALTFVSQGPKELRLFFSPRAALEIPSAAEQLKSDWGDLIARKAKERVAQ